MIVTVRCLAPLAAGAPTDGRLRLAAGARLTFIPPITGG